MTIVMMSGEGADELIKFGVWSSTGADGRKTDITFSPNRTWTEALPDGRPFENGELRERAGSLFLTPQSCGASRRVKRLPGGRPKYQWTYGDGVGGFMEPK